MYFIPGTVYLIFGGLDINNNYCSTFTFMYLGFRQVKFDNGGLILSSRQFLLLPQLPQKMKIASKVVKIDSKKLAR
jgi:hypothetical protein